MNNKEFFNNLNQMKDIKPDAAWKSKNREALMSQIFVSEKVENSEFGWVENFFKTLSGQMMQMSQPAMIAATIMLFIVGGSFASFKASFNTKPGDSFYMAKIVGEKAQLAFTFDEAKKAQLGISFAGKRVTEIDQIKAGTQNTGSQERVDKLITSAQNEIKVAKNIINKINPNPTVVEPEAGQEIFVASFAKKEDGLTISIPGEEDAETDTATSTTASSHSGVTGEEVVVEKPKAQPQLILKEAEEMLSNNDYNATLEKLNIVDEMISQDNLGEVEGETESASSTPASSHSGVTGEDVIEEIPEEETPVE